jgi:hypothetical protein
MIRVFVLLPHGKKSGMPLQCAVIADKLHNVINVLSENNYKRESQAKVPPKKVLAPRSGKYAGAEPRPGVDQRSF